MSPFIKRNYSLDVIKFVALLSILGFHSSCFYYDTKHNILAAFIYRSCIVGIPLFFMSSGYILFKKDNITYEYVYHKIKRILKFIILVCLIFVPIHYIANLQIDVWYFFSTFWGTLNNKGSLFMLWFLWSSIILYMFLPLIRKIFKKTPICMVSIFLVVEILSSITNMFNVMELKIPITLRLHVWMGYFVLGGCFAKYSFFNNLFSKKALTIACLMLFPLNYIYQVNCPSSILTSTCDIFYSSIPTLLLSSVIFLAIVNVDVKSTNAVYIQDLFLPSYIFHPIIMACISFVIIYLPTTISPLLFWIIVSTLTCCFSFIIMRFNIIKSFFRI